MRKCVFQCGILIKLLLAGVVNARFTDYWAVNLEGGEDAARLIAEKFGFIYRGQILPDFYHFQHRKVAKRSVYPSPYYHHSLADDPNVKWIEQQYAKKRVKRDVLYNDPKWNVMWYLNRGKGLDMNVRQAWDQGYTGSGIVVTILDDGIEKDHPDLLKNYDEDASYDVNGHDPDPQPRYDHSNENRHGTRCAGEVAAQADNRVCSVGVAFNANIGGVRMLDGDVTDSVEAQSLSLHPQHVHVYSASWGPDDDGRTVDGPATLARKAFYDGITKGRGGLGSIFVWASGNGGRDGDNCNCDGYTNSIYTLSISSCTESGNIPWYSESCSSTLATTYSSGSSGERQIVTTDLRKHCTETHTGTSASAPLAAGIIALALQANPSLTWRDMQHVVVETARSDNLNAYDWVTNGVGKKVSHSFGFGLMDASAMVSLVRNWTTVPKQHICEIRSTDYNRVVPMNGRLFVPLYTDGCEASANHVRYLEHVQARITMTSTRRGELQISLTSPSLTRSVLLAKRPRDSSREGFNNWAFMTTHNWGEPAKGQWILDIKNGASSYFKLLSVCAPIMPMSADRQVRLRDWVLVLYGTDSHPRKSPTSVRSPKLNPLNPLNTERRYRHKYPYQNPPTQDSDPTYANRTSSPVASTIRFPSVADSNHRHDSVAESDGRLSQQRKEGRNSSDTHSEAVPPQPAPARFKHPHSYYSSHMCVYETLSKISRSKADYSPLQRPPGAHIPRHVLSKLTSADCLPGLFKMDDHCVYHCPDHYYGSVEGEQSPSTSDGQLPHTDLSLHVGVCTRCHPSCLTCLGSSAVDCYQCASGFEWGEEGKSCKKNLLWDILDPVVMRKLAWATVFCIGAIILATLVAAILHVRRHHKLCLTAEECPQSGQTGDIYKQHKSTAASECHRQMENTVGGNQPHGLFTVDDIPGKCVSCSLCQGTGPACGHCRPILVSYSDIKNLQSEKCVCRRENRIPGDLYSVYPKDTFPCQEQELQPLSSPFLFI